MTNARLSQAVTEVAQADLGESLRLSQAVAEVDRLSTSETLHLSQAVIEVDRLSTAETLHLSQAVIEVERLYTGNVLRESQIVIEIVRQRPDTDTDPCEPTVYPSENGLPCMRKWEMTPRERRQRSTIPGRPRARAAWRDRILDVDAEWIYTAEEMDVWLTWYDGTLKNGLLWFTMVAPGYGGWLPRVVRYRTRTLRIERLTMGANRLPVFKVIISLEQRGRSEDPELCVN